MIKLTKNIKQNIIAGAPITKITKSAMFETILGMQLGGNSINNFLNLINQIIFYSNPNNRKIIAENYTSQNAYIRGGSYGNKSMISIG